MHTRIQPPDVYEPVKGLYSQVIACSPGQHFEIAGTLPYHEDGSLEPAILEQTIVMMENFRRTLVAADLVPSDVVRIQVCTPRMDDFLTKGAMKVITEFFGEGQPTLTLLEVSRFANVDVLIQMDATAVRAAGR